MAIYISIDGDNIGNKVAKSYLENDEVTLARTIHNLNAILARISEHLKLMGFEIIYCAADGIACKGLTLEIDALVHHIKTIDNPDFTFSVGIGKDLRTSFFALKYAKAIGKAKLAILEDEVKFKIIDLAV